MTFETIDWNAEAKRVARAFGAMRECEFVSMSDGIYMLSLIPVGPPLKVPFWKRWFGRRLPEESTSLLTEAGLELFVSYHREANTIEALFSLDDDNNNRHPLAYLHRTAVFIMVTLDGSTFTDYSQINPHHYRHPMAKGLFNLGVLTPEIEAALQVEISAHEKLEWALEYEARYGL